MITLVNDYHPFQFRGNSTDTKPTEKWGDEKLENGDEFFEMDTMEVKFYDPDKLPGDPWA